MKERVKKSFSAAARKYGNRALLQKRAGKELLKRLKLIENPYPLLDVGCGDGSLTPKGALGLDIALGMVRETRKRGNLGVCADAEELPFKDSTFKCVISNFALQWTQIKRSFSEIGRVLRKGGLFLASIPVEGSLKTLFECWRETGSSLPLFKFPKEEEVFKGLKGNLELIEFERLNLKMEFKSPKEALKAVTEIGAKNPYGRGKRREVIKFLEIYSKNPVVEYRVFLFTARKV